MAVLLFGNEGRYNQYSACVNGGVENSYYSQVWVETVLVLAGGIQGLQEPLFQVFAKINQLLVLGVGFIGV